MMVSSILFDVGRWKYYRGIVCGEITCIKENIYTYSRRRLTTDVSISFAMYFRGTATVRHLQNVAVESNIFLLNKQVFGILNLVGGVAHTGPGFSSVSDLISQSAAYCVSLYSCFALPHGQLCAGYPSPNHHGPQ